ncbi:hypothetical protein G6F47_004365 [Rhizopus delemar]|nr:hypothetical protein G6F52_002225 [Rhizopus delemar]KAG1600685.1 hypothetical protein G6F47_004365 [Rhizopus delemar]
MNQEQERKVLKDQNGSKAYVKNLKKNNFTGIGYARKSPGQEHQEVRVGLIQKVVNKLYDTLLVDKVLVTTSSRANDTIRSRDTNGKNAQLTLLNQVHGNTQVNPVQLVNFLNAMFLPTDPFNEKVYYCDSLSMDDILAVVWRHTNIFNEKTAQSFSKWCGKNVSSYTVRIEKKQFFDRIIEDIVDHLPRYQQFIKSLKEEEYLVVGYARKSIGEKNDQVRRNEDLLAKINADGDMQDMLRYISAEKKVCIVTLDFAGLTTNHEDLKVFLK